MTVGCARCGAEIPRVDGELTAFCGACGLPRLRVSPDAVTTTTEDAATTAATPHGVRPVLDWAAALKVLGVVSVLTTVGPALLPARIAAATAGGFTLLPLVVLLTVNLYHRSRPRRDITPAIGGRLGAVLGLLMGAWTALMTGLVGFVQRYHYHSHEMDEVFQKSTQMMATQFQGSPALPEMLKVSASPEFHAASLILAHVFSLLMLVFAGTVCGWLAGAVLRSRRQRLVR